MDWKSAVGPYLARAIGAQYRSDPWARIVQIDNWKGFLSALPLKNLTALEISPGPVSTWRNIGFYSYDSVSYPEFDITRQTLPRTFDVIIAEQVFEHLIRPYDAARNVHAMLKPDGVFLIATPFLIRIHEEPGDYTRWSIEGLRHFLQECGFAPDIYSWGNRKCVVANLLNWAEYGWWRDLRNEPNFPVVVWAYARKS